MSELEPEAPPERVVPDLAALSQIEEELGEVERALQRLDEGSYGTCEVCGEALADDGLAEVPVLRRCPAHQAA